MLTGSDLLAKVKELGDVSKSELVRSTGYVITKKDGSKRLNFTAFYEALLKAKGVRLGESGGKTATIRSGTKLSFVATVQGNGNLLIGKAYTNLLGLKPGDQVEIKLSRKQILLVPVQAEEMGELKPVSPSMSDRVVPVWFATDRRPEGETFGNERHNYTSYGRVLVHVPEAHRFGETGSNLWRRLRRFDLRDDRLRLQAVESREHDAFFSEIRAAMESVREEGEVPHALLYLHGFNVSFQEAAIRAAQLDEDLKVSGATAFFSWPSRGSISAYPADEATIEASEPAITNFLIDFTRHCGAEKVHLIAHSMGNRGLLRSLQRIAANTESRSDVKFGQIFLAAPDVDRDLFLSLANLYSQFCDRTTLYASRADRALAISSLLHNAPRAGYYAPYTIAAGIDTVVVPEFNIDFIGHSYYAEAEALLYDIQNLMRFNASPQERLRIARIEHESEQLWKFNR